MSKVKKWCVAALLGLFSSTLLAAPKADLWPLWEPSVSAAESKEVSHAAWQSFLSTYLNTEHASGIYRVDYANVAENDQSALVDYLVYLQNLNPLELSRDEQFAYWVNLYNAATVDLILRNYPVDSITDIKSGWFSFGPWNDELLSINGESVTLNDIEHRILRPIWNEPRIHFVVNCASLGCPNLWHEALAPDNLERVLDEAARAFINHPRGVSINGNTATLSSIFDWYGDDFGDSERHQLEAIAHFLDPDAAEKLLKATRIKFEYDWALNAPDN